MVTTRLIFAGIVLAISVQRLWEVGLSRRHEQALRARGAVEHAPEQMPYMVALHASWLVAMLVEVFVRRPGLNEYVAGVAFVLLVLGQTLRLWAMHTLGERWTVKIITLPNEPPVTTGPFRYLRHPNYLGVMLEIAALPLLHGAFMTSCVFSALNAWLLLVRIRAEERALSEGTDYAQQFHGRGRLIPSK